MAWTTADTGARAPGQKATRRMGVAALALAAISAGLGTAADGAGAALPNCGGNNDIKVAPVTCQNQRTIDGTTFSIVLDVSAGGAITASYTLDAPRAVDTAIRIRAHRGISSNPSVNEDAGTIPAGATSAVLSTQLQCGQIDVKAVYTANGDARGRVSAPYVTDANDCGSTPTTTTTAVTTTAVTTTSATTAPPTSPTTAPTSASQSSLPAGSSTTIPASSRALPATGSNRTLLIASALLLTLGIVLVTKSRVRTTLPE